MLAWAVERDRIGSNPIENAKSLKAETKNYRRALSTEEVERLLCRSPAEYRPIWYTFLATGLRLNELVDLRCGDVDFRRQEITERGEVCKTGRTERIPMSDELTNLLAGMNPVGTDETAHVFTNRDGRPWHNNLLRRFKRCLCLAEIDPPLEEDARQRAGPLRPVRSERRGHPGDALHRGRRQRIRAEIRHRLRTDAVLPASVVLWVVSVAGILRGRKLAPWFRLCPCGCG